MVSVLWKSCDTGGHYEENDLNSSKKASFLAVENHRMNRIYKSLLWPRHWGNLENIAQKSAFSWVGGKSHLLEGIRAVDYKCLLVIGIEQNISQEKKLVVAETFMKKPDNRNVTN